MPFYNRLKINKRDSEKRVHYKRRVADRLLDLRSALKAHFFTPSDDGTDDLSYDTNQYLRLATWNIREFDSTKYGKRMEESYYYIAEILSHFDLTAVQEVREDLVALRLVMKILGPGWQFIATDVTEGKSGNRERMAFVYNTDKVWFRDTAGEVSLPSSDRVMYPHEERLQFKSGLSIVLPEGVVLKPPIDPPTRCRLGIETLDGDLAIELPEGAHLNLPKGTQLVLPHGYVIERNNDGQIVVPADNPLRFAKNAMIKLPMGSIVGDSLQFARSPFLVAFQAGWLKLNLCTVHIYYGSGREGLARRNAEIRKLTQFLGKRAANENHSDADSFFFALGDFNILGRDHDTMKSLLSSGFVIPEKLQTLPGTNVRQDKAYDQIAYWGGQTEDSESVTRVEAKRAGVYDYFETVFKAGDDDPDGVDEAYYRSLTTESTGESGPVRTLMKPDWKYLDWRTHQMSDHLPMWVELCIDFGDEYLARISQIGNES